ncbi:hypothetical protein Ddye_031977 [Dipteronia dyeriana]|uniref:Uncharacterized protein n=1 Tax=Dipteronia dyeriana TaxID=168575 RepID=A0AAD9WP75_9ROSI|nr:hypothetical protein Ddye_031977 [Dipteronia dyeriana]
MAVMGLLFPAVLHYTHTKEHFGKSELAVSRFSSCIMLVAYAVYLVFQLKSQKDLYIPLTEAKSCLFLYPKSSSWRNLLQFFAAETPVGESDEEQDKMLVQIECLDVYKRKVEQAMKSRAQLLQALSDSKPEETSGTNKKICGEIAGSVNLSDQPPVVDETDLSLKKFDEYQAHLQELQMEKLYLLPSAPYASTTWGPGVGLQQPQAPRPPAGKRPKPFPIPQVDRHAQPPRVSSLEKHLVDQLSKEEQNSLDAKLKDAIEADKKVEELEKEIITSRENIQFYHTKMQELGITLSHCAINLWKLGTC